MMMKIRFFERLLAAIAGLCLVLQGVLNILWGLGWQLWVEALQGDHGLIKIIAGVLFIVLGVFLCGLLFRRSSGRKGFVLQNTENGELSISIKAMESLVQKCVDKHEELKVLSTSITNGRDGVVVSLKIGLATGVSIPLAVNSLQKQIKQYITACSGADVQEVRVQVETTNADAKASPYAIEEPEILFEKEPEVPEAAKLPVMNDPQEDKASEATEAIEEKRPLHQRLFGHKEEEATVPVPPQVKAETQEEEKPEVLTEQEESGDETV